MDAINFVKEYGIEKAKEVIEGAPDETVTHFDLTIDGLFYFKFEKFDWFCFYDKNFVKVYMEDYESYHLTILKELKRLIESVDYVAIHGYEKSKEILKNAPDGAECYSWSLGNSGVRDKTVELVKLKKAITDHEAIYGVNCD